MSVDLPEPDGPMIAVKAPRAISTSTPANAATRTAPAPYSFTNPRARAAIGDP